MPATTTRVKVKKQNLRSGERCFKKEKNTKSCRQLYKRYKVKCQQKHTPIQRVFFRRVRGKSDVFERRQTDAVWNVYTTTSLSLKVRAITFFVCLCVHNLKVQVFSGTIAAPENAHLFFFFGEEKNMHQ